MNVMAVKLLKSAKNGRREASVVFPLSHDNIVKLLFTSSSDSSTNSSMMQLWPHYSLALFMEYVPVTLDRRLEDQPLSHEVAEAYARGLNSGLRYLDTHAVCHRDIKPTNLLCHSNEVIKICDFGCAKHLKSGTTTVSYMCSRYHHPLSKQSFT